MTINCEFSLYGLRSHCTSEMYVHCTPTFVLLACLLGLYRLATSQQKRTCKNLACKTCLPRARDMSCTILHNLAPKLARSCKKSANLQVIILAASLAKSCTISCKNRARLCKKRDISRARAKQVLHARFLHDLASSFLLGWLGLEINALQQLGWPGLQLTRWVGGWQCRSTKYRVQAQGIVGGARNTRHLHLEKKSSYYTGKFVKYKGGTPRMPHISSLSNT